MAIKCRECGKEFIRLKKHLEVKHNMNLRTYKKLYPDALTVDPEFSKKMKQYGRPQNMIPIQKGEKRALKKKGKK